MVFIGFGFLMCFLKSHNWSSIGYNYLVAAWAIQIEILWSHFWDQVTKYYHNPEHSFQRLNLDTSVFLNADFGAASVLITMGAIVGKCSLYQLFIVANINIFFYALNKNIIINVFNASDVGGSMTIHVFGAFCGVVTTWFYKPK